LQLNVYGSCTVCPDANDVSKTMNGKKTLLMGKNCESAVQTRQGYLDNFVDTGLASGLFRYSSLWRIAASRADFQV